LRHTTATRAASPMVMCLLDPPYCGLSKKYYQHEESYAGEVDHPALIADTIAAGYDGWALCCSVRSLVHLLPLCPPWPKSRVCAWVKPIGVSGKTYGLHNAWEPLIVVGGRQERPGKRDWLRAMPARGGGELPGRKPIAFCAFLFTCLGMRPGDILVDKFPGTGVVGRAWAEICGYPSPAPGGDGPVADDVRGPGRRVRSRQLSLLEDRGGARP
jgi:hypothetical protein